MLKRIFLAVVYGAGVLTGCKDDEEVLPLQLQQIFVGSISLDLSGANENLPTDRSITLVFSAAVDEESARSAIHIQEGGDAVNASVTFQPDGRSVTLHPSRPLKNNAECTIVIGADLRGRRGESFVPISVTFRTTMAPLVLKAAFVDDIDIRQSNRIIDLPLDLVLTLEFSAAVEAASLKEATSFIGPGAPRLVFTPLEDGKKVEITTESPLRHLSGYDFRIAETFTGADGEPFSGFSRKLYTGPDPTPKFPVIPDDELLTLVQSQTFKYFWDFAHPASGMARERNTSGNLVTSGGSGFGIMALIVGIERGFITREQGLARMETIVGFLESADRFHGAWSHWINGNTGKVIPFSPNDNGGDLVETSFLVQGLLAFRQYLNEGVAQEKMLIDRINALWRGVEWDWYTRGGQNVLYWHWSPDKQWAMNLRVQGYNESMITYLLAVASPTHPVDAAVYHEGWARNGAMVNNNSYFGITLPLGPAYGGPLFFTHYSFLGLDPRNLSDRYANYWIQNVNHARINHAYCVNNPKNFAGYSAACWGLTASDDHQGYSAHSPTNDLGVITPTAALASFPYTPEESMAALHFFYYTLGDRLWGEYGFYDAFNITEGWVADSYLAIDQGPIIVMIENHRTGLLWDLFMSAPEVKDAMEGLGIGY